MPTRRVREVVWEPPSPQYLMEKARKGWTLVALEWEREMDAEELRSTGFNCEVPYGLKIAAGSPALEEDPRERRVLTEMLAFIIRDDVRLSAVAQALNEKGLRTRAGKPWTPVAVFDMLPRLVEVAPAILSAEEWNTLKQRL